jgi:hypothetical protein
MADDPKQGGELNPIALAGGIPAAENLAASYGMLSNISSTLLGIMKNPLISAEGVQQISRRLDEHVIKRLKEMNNLTTAQSQAFDKLARSGEGVRSMFSRMEGFALGAGLRIAYLNEQLERQAATVGKYARLQDLPGGSAFGEARRMQAQYYGNVATYGKALADQMKQAEMQLNTAMFTASGITNPESRSNFSKGLGMYNQMYGGNAGGFVANLFSKYRSRGMTLGKGQDVLEQLRTRMEGGQIFNEQGFEGIQREFLQLSSALGSTGMGYKGGQFLSGAGNLMQATRGMGQEQRQDVYKMVTEAMLSTSQVAKIAAVGLGTTPMALSKQLQQQLLENPEAVIQRISKGIKNTIQKAGGPESEAGSFFMQQLGLGSVEQLKFWTDDVNNAIQPVDKLSLEITKLNAAGRPLGHTMQETARASKDLFDVIFGTAGEAGTKLFGGQTQKVLGYGLSVASLGLLLRSLGKRGGFGKGAGLLLGISELEKMIGSPEVQGAGGNVGGGMDLTTVATIASLAGGNRGTTLSGGGSKGGWVGTAAKYARNTALAYAATELVRGTLQAISEPNTSNLGGIIGYQHQNVKDIGRAMNQGDILGAVGKSFDWMGTGLKGAWRLGVMGTQTVLNTLTLGGAADAVNATMWQNEMKDKRKTATGLTETGAAGSAGSVLIQIVGQNGEDLGKAVAEQGKQVVLRLSAGQVLGVN